MNLRWNLIAALLMAALFVLSMSCGSSNGGDSASSGNNNTAYTVSFNSSGGSSIADSNNLPFDHYINTEPIPTKASYLFGGWYVNPNLAGEMVRFPFRVTADTTLYARWVAEPGFTVTFDTAGGSAVEPITGVARITVMPKSDKHGYEFLGWVDNNTASTSIIIAPYAVKNNITLHAMFMFIDHGCELTPRWRTLLGHSPNG